MTLDDVRKKIEALIPVAEAATAPGAASSFEWLDEQLSRVETLGTGVLEIARSLGLPVRAVTPPGDEE